MRELRDRFISRNQNQWTIFSHSFSVAFRLDYFVTSVLLLYKPGDHLLFPAHNRGRGVVEIITLTDCAEFRKPPVRVRVTSDICKFLNLFQNHLMIPVYLFVMP